MQSQDSPDKNHGLNLVRDLEVPPADFNAVAANEAELRRYGLPPRPDGDRHPAQAALWDKFAARSLQFVRPNLVPVTDHVPSELRDFHEQELNADLRALHWRLQDTRVRLCWIIPATSSNWSGAWVKRPASEPLVTVTGQWVVPNVSPPRSAWNGTSFNDGTYICAAWVGLDGTNGTNDVLQAGTHSIVTVSNGVVSPPSFDAWIEWYGNPWKVEPDFLVNAGDAILCTVCAPFRNNQGLALFVNQTTGLAARHVIDHPAGVTLSGNVAEWIVEDPAQLSGVLYPFPNYGFTTFQNCSAGSKNISLNLGDACPINLIDGSGTVLSDCTITSDTSLKCEYNATRITTPWRH